MSALRVLLVFALWIGFLGVGIWLLIRFFRNRSFLSEHRVWRRVVQALIVLLVVALPWLALVVLLIIEVSTRSSAEQKRELPVTTPSADAAPHHRSLPFPPAPTSSDD